MEPRALGVCRPSPSEESFRFFSSSWSVDRSDRGTWPYASLIKITMREPRTCPGITGTGKIASIRTGNRCRRGAPPRGLSGSSEPRNREEPSGSSSRRPFIATEGRRYQPPSYEWGFYQRKFIVFLSILRARVPSSGSPLLMPAQPRFSSPRNHGLPCPRPS